MPMFNCKTCNKSFNGRVKKDRINRYCSNICSYESKIKDKIKKICITCNSEYILKFQCYKNRKFCSSKCVRYQGPTEILGLYRKNRGFWKNSSDEEKFERMKEMYNQLVIKTDDCWGWKRKPFATGYAPILANKGKTMNAHRFSWIMHFGKIPNKLFVLHKCDNRICTNPEHLFLGTHKDNMNDMKIKGRTRKAKL